MTDHLPNEKRSWNMSRIRSKNTIPEVKVRSILHCRGYRFRLHRKDLPGKPDVVLPKYKTVIFVHGCFWHQHKNCNRGNTPKTNKQYWLPKLRRNVENFKKNQRKLKKLGWQVIVIWECEVKYQNKIQTMINKIQNRVSLQY
jgi:DNA mismatch endonuclease (patch repair protein)